MSKKKFKVKVKAGRDVRTEEEILEQELKDLVEGRDVKPKVRKFKDSDMDHDPERGDLDEEVVPETEAEFKQRLEELSITAESMVDNTKKLLDEQERQGIDLDIEEAHLLNSQAKEEYKQKVTNVDKRSTQLFEKKVNELRGEASTERQLKVAQLQQIEEERKLKIQEEKSVSAQKLLEKLKGIKDKEQKIEALKQKEVNALKLRVQKISLDAEKKKQSVLSEITSIDANLNARIARLGHQINSTKRQLITTLDHELDQTLAKNNRVIQEAQGRLSGLDGWDVVKEEECKEAVVPKTIVDEGGSHVVSPTVEPEEGVFATAPSEEDVERNGVSHGVSAANQETTVRSDASQELPPERIQVPFSHDALDEGLMSKLRFSKDYKEAITHWNDSMQSSAAQNKPYIMHSEKKENGVHTITWVDPRLTEEQRKNPDFHVIYKIDQKTGVLSSIESGCNVVCSIPPIPRSGGGFDVVSINKGKVSLPVQKEGGVSALSIKAHSKPFNNRSQQAQYVEGSTTERTEAQKEADKYADYGISLMIESPGAGPRVSDMAHKLAEAYGADKKDMEARILSSADKLKVALEESKRLSHSTGSPSSPPGSPEVFTSVRGSRLPEI